eukprot:tig00000806_g4374.t1
MPCPVAAVATTLNMLNSLLDNAFFLHGLLEAGFGAVTMVSPHTLLNKRPGDLPEVAVLALQAFGLAVTCFGLLGLLMWPSPNESADKRKAAHCFMLYHVGAAYGCLSPALQRQRLALGIADAKSGGITHIAVAVLFALWILVNKPSPPPAPRPAPAVAPAPAPVAKKAN